MNVSGKHAFPGILPRLADVLIIGTDAHKNSVAKVTRKDRN